MVVYAYMVMGGVGRGSGWLVRVVERVRGVQKDPCWRREGGVRLLVGFILMLAQDLAYDLSYSLQSLEDKKERVC
jgi:hypothetical protein